MYPRALARLGDVALDPTLTFYDPMTGNDSGGWALTPTVTITPGQEGSGDTLPAPSFAPEPPQAAPQILPDLVTVTAPAPVVATAGFPWALVLLAVGVWGLSKARGTRDF